MMKSEHGSASSFAFAVLVFALQSALARERTVVALVALEFTLSAVVFAGFNLEFDDFFACDELGLA
jgi:hypothetical protein